MRTQETCRRGHPRTPENVYQYPRKNGSIRIMCRVCNSLRDKSDPDSYPARRNGIGPNAYRVAGDIAYLILQNHREAMIDRTDLEVVLAAGRWCCANGYVVRGAMKLHRFLLLAQPGQIVDHINRNPLDCRRCNLRIVTSSQNCQNQTIVGRKNGSGQRNVAWVPHLNRWLVRVMVGGVVHYGGVWVDFDYAVRKASELRRRVQPCCPENSLPLNG